MAELNILWGDALLDEEIQVELTEEEIQQKEIQSTETKNLTEEIISVEEETCSMPQDDWEDWIKKITKQCKLTHEEQKSIWLTQISDEFKEKYWKMIELLIDSSEESDHAREFLKRTQELNQARRARIASKGKSAKTLIICRYECHNNIPGNKAPGGANYKPGCAAHEYGECDFTHQGEVGWDRAVKKFLEERAAKNKGSNSHSTKEGHKVHRHREHTEGAGSGGHRSRRENRHESTTVAVESTTVDGNTGRDRRHKHTSSEVDNVTSTTSSVGGAGNGHRSHHRRSHVERALNASTTTSGAGAGQGNRVQEQQTYQSGKGKGKPNPTNKFALLQDEM